MTYDTTTDDVYGGASSDLPYYTNLKVMSNAECKTKFPDTYLTKYMICSTDNQGNKERDTCQVRYDTKIKPEMNVKIQDSNTPFTPYTCNECT